MHEILRYLEQQSNLLLTTASLTLLALIAALDALTGPELSFSIFYLIPIALVSWFVGMKPGQWFSAASALVWLAVETISGRSYSHLLIPLWNMLVRFGFFIIVASILATLKSKLEAESKLARRDFLTGLANSRAFYELAEVELDTALAQKRELTLAYVEADGLKWINERYGRLAGDQLLCVVAETLQTHVPNRDLVARTGGALFAVLIPGIDPESARLILSKIQESLKYQMQKKYQQPIKFSIVATAFVTPPRAMGEFLQEAERLTNRLTEKSREELEIEVVDSSRSSD